MIKKTTLFCLLFSCLFINAQDKNNQEPKQVNNSWHFLVEPYLMFPNMNGSTQIGTTLPTVEVDANTEDIFSVLKMGGMLYLEAKKGDWAITSDFIYMKLKKDITPNFLVQSGELELKETLWEVAGLRRISPMFEAGLGLRLVNVSTDLNLALRNQDIHADVSETWVDPIFIVRSNHIIKDDFLLNVRGDVGGFGIGSDLTWQIHVDAGYQVSELFYVMLGYRYLGIDFETGNNQNYFAYDMDTFGPELRLGFNF